MAQLSPAMRAHLVILGREDILHPRFWLGDGIRVVLTLTDVASGAPIANAAGIRLLLDRPGLNRDEAFEPPAEQISPGVFAWDVVLDLAGPWQLCAEASAPRFSAARIGFDVVA